ncbi:hypothetical protein SISSUDRAFT_416211 [Sistotremastrum suecicum HHB10207 ss-3]|uniref:DUF7330 domain-containing protein n=1 Tax=Sistotremastrum suecicum HHB10207 ss-3 TaxID=1314776 RepID=A0A166FQ56_9AGAM|nr:hypothetical protein SISSUDRAFT_416211 [Sistotremastrum suecicum HHB10207 ss-3]
MIFNVTKADLPPLPPSDIDSIVTTTDGSSISPPPYNPSSPTISNPIPATNCLDISRCKNITGSWRIDTSLRVPSLNDANDTDERGNVNLLGRFGDINAEVELVGDATSSRAVLRATATRGSITFKLISPRRQTAKIECASRSGSITVFLPPSFRGPITIGGVTRSLIFSPGIQSKLMTFSERDDQSSHFLGDYPQGGIGPDEKWEGDELSLTTGFGKIRLYYLGETIEPPKKSKRRFGR